MASSRPKNRRNDIIQAALRLFARKGIRATTIRDIAHETGLTEGALYRHFSSKEELARWLFVDSVRALYDYLAEAVAPVENSPARLCVLARGLFDFAALEPDTYEYVMARHHDGLGTLPPGQKPPMALFVEVLRQGIGEGSFRPMDPAVGAAVVIGICQRVIFFLDRDLTAGSREEAVAEVCRALQRIFDIQLPGGLLCATCAETKN